MKRVILPITLAPLAACRPAVVARVPAAVAVQSTATALPKPGVYVLRRVNDMALPADIKPPGYDPRHGSNFIERVLGGWLYLTVDSGYHRYRTMMCADLVDSAGRVPNTLDRGPAEGRYWAAGGRVYFSLLVVDGPQDSAAVHTRGDTLEFMRKEYVLDRIAVRPRNLIPAYVCAAVRAPAGGRTPR